MKNLLQEKTVYTVDAEQLDDLMYQMLLLLCDRDGKDIEQTDLGIEIKIIDQKLVIEYQTNTFDDVEFINIPQSEDDVDNFMTQIRDLVSQIYDFHLRRKPFSFIVGSLTLDYLNFRRK